MTVRVVTCSTGGLTKEMADEFGITVIPYYAFIEGKTIVEDFEFDARQYYRDMRVAKKLPTTSHPTPLDIQETYRKLAQASSEPILYLTISSQYTATYELALMAKEEFPDQRIEVYDTGQTAAHQALTAIEAARFASSGATVEEILAFMEKNKGRIDEVIILNTLEYLAKGGRIGRAQALLGNLLSQKPLIGFRDGVTTPFGRVRTHKQGLNFILERIRSDMDRLGDRRIRVIIEDADNREQADIAEKALRENFDCEELYHINLSIVTGTHMGPGTWGVAYYVL